MKSFRVIADGSFIIAACFLVVLALTAMTINVWGWNSANVAAWVQAIGSIFAIGGAYFVGERQARATLRTTQEAHRLGERARREGMFSVIGAAHSRAKEIKEALDDQSPPIKMYGVYHASLIDSLVDLMTKLPVSELGSDQAINAFIIFSGQFAFLRKALEEYMAGPYADPEVMEELEKLKVQGYGNREHDQVVDSKRAVLKTNVEVHLARIDIEFTHLSAALQKNA